MPAPLAPLVSVVVPMFNVERYLLDCLESLAGQTLRDLEVVMVDDGSTDSTASIAAAFAARDSRFVLVRQPNGGLGQARNAGADRATGEYLAFVDSDDMVTSNAYRLLDDSLVRTGSDFATGNYHRLTTVGTRQAGMVFTAFNANRPRTHVSRHPALINDRTAWNKVFRRTFWDEHGFRWPEGVLYEDIAVTIPAHVLAQSVDVIREPVYLWRARAGDAASITQCRTELRAIRDRYRAVDLVSRFLDARGQHHLKALYDRSVAAQDFRYFLQHLDEADDDFRLLFLDLANDFFDRSRAAARPEAVRRLPVPR
jgi:CDP-glycerol glycerophosphotransferase